jgi:hypothetical protein
VQSALEVSPYKWKKDGCVQKPEHVHMADAPGKIYLKLLFLGSIAFSINVTFYSK